MFDLTLVLFTIALSLTVAIVLYFYTNRDPSTSQVSLDHCLPYELAQLTTEQSNRQGVSQLASSANIAKVAIV